MVRIQSDVDKTNLKNMNIYFQSRGGSNSFLIVDKFLNKVYARDWVNFFMGASSDYNNISSQNYMSTDLPASRASSDSSVRDFPTIFYDEQGNEFLSWEKL